MAERPDLRRRHRRRLRRAGRGAAEVVLRRAGGDRRLRPRSSPRTGAASACGSLRPIPGAFAARLTGVATREEAEALKGTRLYAPRDRLPPLGDDEYYHADLIGLAVVDTGGAALGTVRAVLDHGAGDILEIARPGAARAAAAVHPRGGADGRSRRAPDRRRSAGGAARARVIPASADRCTPDARASHAVARHTARHGSG